jgi:hypothetical protein
MYKIRADPRLTAPSQSFSGARPGGQEFHPCHPVRHEACVNIKRKPMWMKEPHNPICRSG